MLVFRSIPENATRICGARFANLLLYEGEAFKVVAVHGAPPQWSELRGRETTVAPPGNDPLGRLWATGRLQHVTDMRTEPAYIAGHPAIVPLVDVAGVRTHLIVPMLKEHEPVGAIGINRQEVQPFNDKQAFGFALQPLEPKAKESAAVS